MRTSSRPASPRQQEIRVLQETLHLEHSTWQFYQGASHHLTDPDEAQAVADFASDHRQHLIALRTRLALLGSNIHNASPGERLRRVGQRLFNRIGDSASLLARLGRQEALMHSHYRSIAVTDLSRASRGLMLHSLCDEQGHHRWLEDRLRTLRRHSIMPVHVIPHLATSHWAHARL